MNSPIASDALTSRLQVGHRIAVARRAAKLTQTELAARCGVSPARVSKLERGFSKPRPEELDALARVLPTINAPMPPARPPTAAPMVANAVKTVEDLPELARVRDVADLLDCSAGTIYSLVKEGKLSGVRLGRLLRVRRDSVRALVHGEA